MSKTSPTPLACDHWYDPRKSSRDLGSGAGSALLRRRVSCSPFHCVCAPTTPDLPPLTRLSWKCQLHERRHPVSPRPRTLRFVTWVSLTAQAAATLRQHRTLSGRIRSPANGCLLGSGVVGPLGPTPSSERNSSPLTPPSVSLQCASRPWRDAIFSASRGGGMDSIQVAGCMEPLERRSQIAYIKRLAL